MQLIKVSDGVYRLPITAGEYVGIFRSGRKWVLSHPRLDRTMRSFSEAKRVARQLAADLGAA